ncbi:MULTISPECIES: phosphotransferase family protein [unclassified Sphingomonas]|uniref:phosphotransferase family protein n=1 Tax=unclassified Sphingomonas TaxID=196159 RepID=UPI0009266D17|nr:MULTISPECIES: phosphotransferase family protein [unclassified Sphingomonas]MBN8848622.1 phosphotransferase family protein [Sphingomonas sp.]OJV34788.1 MAG: hypothetical protein BGO24_01545 [Sphingomonas sp. 67-36]
MTVTAQNLQQDDEAADLLDWIARATGAKDLVAERPAPMGRSRDIWTIEGRYPDGARLSSVVRHEVGSGPWSGTTFTLAREASVLRSLQPTPVKVPAVIAVSDDGTRILIERLAGTAEFKFDDPAMRASTIDDFCLNLARLHLVDERDLELDLPRPANVAEHAHLDLRDYVHSYEKLCPRAAGVDAGFAWLFANAPKHVQRTSLLQGDCGPGNFMHQDGKLTGLIDWEAAHFGDPMDDLAMLWFRICFMGGGNDLDDWYQLYAKHSGLDVDLDAIAYYRVALLTRWAIAVLVRQGNEPVRDDAKRERMLSLITTALRDPYNREGRADALPPVVSGAIPTHLRES